VPLADGNVRPSSAPKKVEPDGALILFSLVTGEEYDFWQVTTNMGGGGVEGTGIRKAGQVAWFSVGDQAPGCQLPVCDPRQPGSLPRASSRATGVPYLAGLLVPEDFAIKEQIGHALVFSLPQLRRIPGTSTKIPADFVYPATNTEANNSTPNPFALAAGMRIRLKNKFVDMEGTQCDVSLPRFAPVTRLFLQALQLFGAYLVDVSKGFGFAAEDIWTAFLDLPNCQLAKLVDEPLTDIETALKSKTKWNILMTKLTDQVSSIPFALGPKQGNFEVVDNARIP
jgi:hypothetical protein